MHFRQLLSVTLLALATNVLADWPEGARWTGEGPPQIDLSTGKAPIADKDGRYHYPNPNPNPNHKAGAGAAQYPSAANADFGMGHSAMAGSGLSAVAGAGAGTNPSAMVGSVAVPSAATAAIATMTATLLDTADDEATSSANADADAANYASDSDTDTSTLSKRDGPQTYGGVYECEYDNWMPPCTWTMTTDSKCRNKTYTNFVEGSIGVDKGVYCMQYSDYDCHGDWVANVAWGAPGADSVTGPHWFAKGAQWDNGPRSWQCQLIGKKFGR